MTYNTRMKYLSALVVLTASFGLSAHRNDDISHALAMGNLMQNTYQTASLQALQEAIASSVPPLDRQAYEAFNTIINAVEGDDPYDKAFALNKAMTKLVALINHRKLAHDSNYSQHELAAQWGYIKTMVERAMNRTNDQDAREKFEKMLTGSLCLMMGSIFTGVSWLPLVTATQKCSANRPEALPAGDVIISLLVGTIFTLCSFPLLKEAHNKISRTLWFDEHSQRRQEFLAAFHAAMEKEEQKFAL